jgi:hypothetical protein
MRWVTDPQLADMVLSARAEAQHPGYIALQPIIDLLELVAARFARRPPRTPRDDERRSRSSLPPCS